MQTHFFLTRKEAEKKVLRTTNAAAARFLTAAQMSCSWSATPSVMFGDSRKNKNNLFSYKVEGGPVSVRAGGPAQVL